MASASDAEQDEAPRHTPAAWRGKGQEIMIDIDYQLHARQLKAALRPLFDAAAAKIRSLHESWDPETGTPVFTAGGAYTTRGWTEWTQGFMYGMPLYLFDASGEREFLELGREGTRRVMAPHLSHTGVHDHGFNNISTYGNLLRLMEEGRIEENRWEREFYLLALKVSGAVQAARWTALPGSLGFIHTFNGPHSLFADTMRSLRVLAAAHEAGHVLMGENDARISLLGRLLQHAESTARWNVYYGTGRDGWDLRGRVAHESIFNVTNGAYRCPSSQQGYSPFTTWTRGHAWVLLGFAEELEYLYDRVSEEAVVELRLPYYPDLASAEARFRETACAAADFYLEQTPVDGVPYWDTGAPNLHRMGDYLARPADPFNAWEPVDSSAAAIAAQGLLRLGRYLERRGDAERGGRYRQAGLSAARTLLDEPYLSRDPRHQGLLLHSLYHYPGRWDRVQPGQSVPNGESCMWGDYHLLELAVYLQRLAEGGPELYFYRGVGEETGDGR
jgi:hypothetical protein